MENNILNQKHVTSQWFTQLRDMICSSYEAIEKEYATANNKPTSPRFIMTKWERGSNGGGGEMSIMKGEVFEKVGVNISTVEGEFEEKFAKEIPGCEEKRNFFATGISLVAHPKSPMVPATHFNTRYIETTKSWFGGGADLTPVYEEEYETNLFHNTFKQACNKFNPAYYEDFSKQCDEYFYIKHREEPRGAGGIFFDYLNTKNFNQDFEFIKEVGLAMYNIYPIIVKRKMNLTWNETNRMEQLKKRAKYVEFNLLYDRGTRFGLMTKGNINAIFMSLPPLASWD